MQPYARIALGFLTTYAMQLAAEPLPRFSPTAVWNQNISAVALDPASSSMIAALALDATGGGDLGHAIRFTIRNERMASDDSLGGVGGRLYVRPASHAGSPSGPSTTIPYGARLRMNANFPLTGYNPAARVLLNTFKRYGIVLADGGNITLTAESDLFTTTKWTDLDIDSRVFDLTVGAQKVNVTDFAVIDTGPRIGETWDCVRSVLPPPPVFKDGFENQGL